MTIAGRPGAPGSKMRPGAFAGERLFLSGSDPSLRQLSP
jgi:hypothetical protein